MSDKERERSFCYKCKNSTTDYINFRTQICCRACLEKFIQSTFRSTLRTCCNVNRGDNILICVSNRESLCLANLVVKALKEERKTKKCTLNFNLLGIYHVANILNSDCQIQTHKDVDNDLSYNNFTLAKIVNYIKFCFPEDQIFSKLNDESVEELSYAFQELNRKDVVPSSSKWIIDDLKSIIFQRTIYGYIRKQVIDGIWPQSLIHVFLGDSMTKIAHESIISLCKGSGTLLPFISGYIDDRYGNVFFVRPFKKILGEELLFFDSSDQSKFLSGTTNALSSCVQNYLHDLQSGNSDSVSSLAQFINKLDTTTIDRTGTNSYKNGVCKVCFCPKEFNEVFIKNQYQLTSRQQKILHELYNRLNINYDNELIIHPDVPLCFRCIQIAAAASPASTIIWHLLKTGSLLYYGKVAYNL